MTMSSLLWVLLFYGGFGYYEGQHFHQVDLPPLTTPGALIVTADEALLLYTSTGSTSPYRTSIRVRVAYGRSVAVKSKAPYGFDGARAIFKRREAKAVVGDYGLKLSRSSLFLRCPGVLAFWTPSVGCTVYIRGKSGQSNRVRIEGRVESVGLSSQFLAVLCNRTLAFFPLRGGKTLQVDGVDAIGYRSEQSPVVCFVLQPQALFRGRNVSQSELTTVYKTISGKVLRREGGEYLPAELLQDGVTAGLDLIRTHFGAPVRFGWDSHLDTEIAATNIVSNRWKFFWQYYPY